MSVIKIGGGGTSIISHIEKVLRQKLYPVISDNDYTKKGFKIFKNYKDNILSELEGIVDKKTLIFIKEDDEDDDEDHDEDHDESISSQPPSDSKLNNNIKLNKKKAHEHSPLTTERTEYVTSPTGQNISDEPGSGDNLLGNNPVVGGKHRRTAKKSKKSKKSRSRRHRKTRK